jgi:hypothetical protein
MMANEIPSRHLHRLNFSAVLSPDPYFDQFGVRRIW